MSDAPVSPPRPIDELVAGLEAFSKLRVLVVGDLFLDEYIEGEMFEISKEGPIPVVRLESRVRAAGAAGNLASSIRNLGAAVSVVGVVGRDGNGDELVGELRDKGIDTEGIIVDENKPTLTYSKIRARVENAPSREILRLDVLPDGPLPSDIENDMLLRVQHRVGEVDGVIVLDQIDHLITARLLDELPAWTRAHGAFLQGSSRDRLAAFRDFDLVIPNDVEARDALDAEMDDAGLSEDAIAALGDGLRERFGHRRVLLTLGADGMALFAESKAARGATRRLPTFATDVVDVTGAGDAVSSAAILGSLLGWDLTTAAWAAAHSAAIALGHVGTHHVTCDELGERLRGGRLTP